MVLVRILFTAMIAYMGVAALAMVANMMLPNIQWLDDIAEAMAKGMWAVTLILAAVCIAGLMGIVILLTWTL